MIATESPLRREIEQALPTTSEVPPPSIVASYEDKLILLRKLRDKILDKNEVFLADSDVSVIDLILSFAPQFSQDLSLLKKKLTTKVTLTPQESQQVLLSTATAEKELRSAFKEELHEYDFLLAESATYNERNQDITASENKLEHHVRKLLERKGADKGIGIELLDFIQGIAADIESAEPPTQVKDREPLYKKLRQTQYIIGEEPLSLQNLLPPNFFRSLDRYLRGKKDEVDGSLLINQLRSTNTLLAILYVDIAADFNPSEINSVLSDIINYPHGTFISQLEAVAEIIDSEHITDNTSEAEFKGYVANYILDLIDRGEITALQGKEFFNQITTAESLSDLSEKLFSSYMETVLHHVTGVSTFESMVEEILHEKSDGFRLSKLQFGIGSGLAIVLLVAMASISNGLPKLFSDDNVLERDQISQLLRDLHTAESSQQQTTYADETQETRVSEEENRERSSTEEVSINAGMTFEEFMASLDEESSTNNSDNYDSSSKLGGGRGFSESLDANATSAEGLQSQAQDIHWQFYNWDIDSSYFGMVSYNSYNSQQQNFELHRGDNAHESRLATLYWDYITSSDNVMLSAIDIQKINNDIPIPDIQGATPQRGAVFIETAGGRIIGPYTIDVRRYAASGDSNVSIPQDTQEYIFNTFSENTGSRLLLALRYQQVEPISYQAAETFGEEEFVEDTTDVLPNDITSFIENLNSNDSLSEIDSIRALESHLTSFGSYSLKEENDQMIYVDYLIQIGAIQPEDKMGTFTKLYYGTLEPELLQHLPEQPSIGAGECKRRNMSALAAFEQLDLQSYEFSLQSGFRGDGFYSNYDGGLSGAQAHLWIEAVNLETGEKHIVDVTDAPIDEYTQNVLNGTRDETEEPVDLPITHKNQWQHEGEFPPKNDFEYISSYDFPREYVISFDDFQPFSSSNSSTQEFLIQNQYTPYDKKPWEITAQSEHALYGPSLNYELTQDGVELDNGSTITMHTNEGVGSRHENPWIMTKLFLNQELSGEHEVSYSIQDWQGELVPLYLPDSALLEAGSFQVSHNDTSVKDFVFGTSSTDGAEARQLWIQIPGGVGKEDTVTVSYNYDRASNGYQMDLPEKATPQDFSIPLAELLTEYDSRGVRPDVAIRLTKSELVDSLSRSAVDLTDSITILENTYTVIPFESLSETLALVDRLFQETDASGKPLSEYVRLLLFANIIDEFQFSNRHNAENVNSIVHFVRSELQEIAEQDGDLSMTAEAMLERMDDLFEQNDDYWTKKDDIDELDEVLPEADIQELTTVISNFSNFEIDAVHTEVAPSSDLLREQTLTLAYLREGSYNEGHAVGSELLGPFLNGELPILHPLWYEYFVSNHERLKRKFSGPYSEMSTRMQPVLLPSGESFIAQQTQSIVNPLFDRGPSLFGVPQEERKHLSSVAFDPSVDPEARSEALSQLQSIANAWHRSNLIGEMGIKNEWFYRAEFFKAYGMLLASVLALRWGLAFKFRFFGKRQFDDYNAELERILAQLEASQADKFQLREMTGESFPQAQQDLERILYQRPYNLIKPEGRVRAAVASGFTGTPRQNSPIWWWYRRYHLNIIGDESNNLFEGAPYGIAIPPELRLLPFIETSTRTLDNFVHTTHAPHISSLEIAKSIVNEKGKLQAELSEQDLAESLYKVYVDQLDNKEKVTKNLSDAEMEYHLRYMFANVFAPKFLIYLRQMHTFNNRKYNPKVEKIVNALEEVVSRDEISLSSPYESSYSAEFTKHLEEFLESLDEANKSHTVGIVGRSHPALKRRNVLQQFNGIQQPERKIQAGKMTKVEAITFIEPVHEDFKKHILKVISGYFDLDEVEQGRVKITHSTERATVHHFYESDGEARSLTPPTLNLRDTHPKTFLYPQLQEVVQSDGIHLVIGPSAENVVSGTRSAEAEELSGEKLVFFNSLTGNLSKM